MTVERFEDGEVSPYLVDDLEVGDAIEVRGPVGGWLVWRPEDTKPVQLIAGGSGVAPLMSMLRTTGGDGLARCRSACCTASPTRTASTTRRSSPTSRDAA